MCESVALCDELGHHIQPERTLNLLKIVMEYSFSAQLVYSEVCALLFFNVLYFSSSGSDGLVKLWTIKTNECVKTLDAHQDKVWGLHGSRRDDKVVTGSADSNITVWVVSRM